MKKILAVVLALAPVAALASSNSIEDITGRVKVQRVECFRAPCPPLVSIETAGGKEVELSGEMAQDVAAFKGAVVTVKGSKVDGFVEPIGFAPGKSGSFITGTVKDVTDCPANARCRPQVAVEMNGIAYRVEDDKLAHDLINLKGATVTLRGDAMLARCPGCGIFHPDTDANILVKGNLRQLEHVLNGESHMLMLPTGETVMVSGKPSWSDRNYADVWLSGSFGEDMISHTPVFRASKASRSIYVAPQIEPFPGTFTANDGSNAGRDASTTPVSSASDAGSSSAGAGVHH